MIEPMAKYIYPNCRKDLNRVFNEKGSITVNCLSCGYERAIKTEEITIQTRLTL